MTSPIQSQGLTTLTESPVIVPIDSTLQSSCDRPDTEHCVYRGNIITHNIQRTKLTLLVLIYASVAASLLITNKNLLPFIWSDEGDFTAKTATPKRPLVAPQDLMPTRRLGVILTSFFTQKKDPQRGRYVKPTYEYMRNFHVSVQHLGLHVRVFHDGLSEAFIAAYENEHFKFIRVGNYSEMSINDYRFVAYNQFLEKDEMFSFFLAADISDVVFTRDPFQIMLDRPYYSMFASPDGTLVNRSRFMRRKMKKCFRGIPYVAMQHEHTLNAGVWGGTKEVGMCMMECIADELQGELQGRGNCNMGAYNYCARLGGCANKTQLHVLQTGDVNPMRRDCCSNHTIIHNKCRDESIIRVEVLNGTLKTC